MARFLMLARDSGAWGEVSPEEAQRIIQQYIAWGDRLRKAGHLIGSDKLKDGEGRVLRTEASQIAVKDGPYSETKEVIGGYWLLNARDYDHAVAMAKDSPHMRFGTLEIRAIEEL